VGALGTCIALTTTSTGPPTHRASCFAPGFGLRRPVGSNICVQAGSMFFSPWTIDREDTI
jgi:hypothetical protein